MPRFALAGDFWAIEQDGVRLVIEDNGTEKIRRFVSEQAAALQMGRLIAEKRTAGWAPATGSATQEEPREPALEAAIHANPDDRESYAVYADWYQERGHPRGELIALQLADEPDAAKRAAIEQLLERSAPKLLGGLRKFISRWRESPLRWRYGFIHALVLDEADALPREIVREVVAHASGRFLVELELAGYHGDSITELLAAAAGAPALRRVRIATTSGSIDDLSPLERTSIRTLELAGYAQQGVTARGLAALARVPATLRDLHLRLAHAGDGEQMIPLFDREDLMLDRLVLRTPQAVDPWLSALAIGPLAPHLRELDFAFTDPGLGADAIVKQLSRFRRLKRVGLTEHLVSTRLVQALSKVARVVDIREDEDDPGARDDDYEPVVE